MLDVGANIGFYTVPIAKALQAIGGQLYAFDPVPSNIKRLRENLEINGVSGIAMVHDYGLSSEDAIQALTLREDFELGGETGNAAILIEHSVDKRFRTMPVRVRPLDDVAVELGLERIDFMKLDVEGHEDHVLAGGRQVLGRCRPAMLIEINKRYYRRRGVTLELRLPEVMPENYRLFRLAKGGWRAIASVAECDALDDVLALPAERDALIRKIAT